MRRRIDSRGMGLITVTTTIKECEVHALSMHVTKTGFVSRIVLTTCVRESNLYTIMEFGHAPFRIDWASLEEYAGQFGPTLQLLNVRVR